MACRVWGEMGRLDLQKIRNIKIASYESDTNDLVFEYWFNC